MKNYILFGLLFLSIFKFEVYAQKSKVAAGDRKYEKYAYIDAIKTYEIVANKGYKSADMFQKLGNSYYFNSNFEGAVKWYEALFAMNTAIEPEYYYRYAQSLRATGQTDKADTILQEFASENKNDSRGILSQGKRNYLARDMAKLSL